MRKPSQWKHKKYKSMFVGKYERAGKDHVFQLSNHRHAKYITFDSYQSAKQDGWVKVS